MFSLNITLLFLVVAVFSVVFGQSGAVVKLISNPDSGDYELNVVTRGGVSVVKYKTEDGESATEVFTTEGFEVERPAGKKDCYLTPLDQDNDPGKQCTQKNLLTETDVPKTIADFCEGRSIYAVEQVPCKGTAGRQRRGCGVTCWTCSGGVCCGVKCSWSW